MADGNVIVRLSALANVKQVDKFAGRLQKVDGVAKKLKKVLAGVFAVATIKKILDVNEAYTRQQNDLASLTGSMDVAKRTMQDMQRVAKRSAFTTSQMTNAFIALKSNGLDPTADFMQSMGQFASYAGSNIDTVSKALERASLGRMRRISELLGTKVTMDGDRVFATINGELVESQYGIKGFMRQLERIQGKEWAKAEERDLATLTGAMNKLKDAAGLATVAFATGFAGDLPAAVQKFTDAIETLMPVFELLGKVVGSLLDPVLDAIDWVSGLGDGYEIVLGNIEDWIAAIVVALGAMMVAAKLGFAVFAWPVALVAAIAAGLFALFKFFTSDHGKSFLEKALERTRAMIASLKAAFADLGKWIRGLFDSVLSDVDAIFGNYFRAIVSLLKGDFSGFAEYMQASIMAVFDFLLRHVSNVLGLIDKGAKMIGLDTNLQGLTANMTGRPSVPTQTSSNVNSTVGKVEVNVTGNTNASAADVGRSVSKGVDDALGRQTRRLQHNYAGT